MQNNLLYGITDKPKTVKEWAFYSIQQVLAVFVATVLIANICGTPVNACLLGAGLATIIYQIITKFRSPMFISSCGATVSAVMGALAIGDGSNYLAVAIGGLVILAIYGVFSIIVKLKGVESINKIFPPVIVGPVTMVIGLNLATFINGYTQIGGEHNNVAILVAIFTMLVVALASHYFKGFLRTIPFLIGLAAGYGLAVVITLCGGPQLVDFNVFKNVGLFEMPDFSFLHWNSTISLGLVGQVTLLFAPVAICALLEHYSDHKVLSNIIGTDLTVEPGLHRTLLGDGVASFVGTVVCGLPNTSYGESIATTGFSKVASVKVLTLSSVIIAALSFLAPIQALIASIPACVFGGCAMILYGYIAISGLKTIINNKVDLENNKNLVITAVILTVGVSGIFLFHESFAAVALAMVLGVILNLTLR